VTLKRSAQTLKLAEETYARTEERYRADTLEARNEKLRSAVMDASHKVGQVWTARTLDHLALLIERAHLLRGGASDERLDENVKAIVDFQRGPMQSTIGDAFSALDNADFLAAGSNAVDTAIKRLRQAFVSAITEPEMDIEMWAAAEVFDQRTDEIRVQRDQVLSLNRRLISTARATLSGSGSAVSET
jgi:hypothetical protein